MEKNEVLKGEILEFKEVEECIEMRGEYGADRAWIIKYRVSEKMRDRILEMENEIERSERDLRVACEGEDIIIEEAFLDKENDFIFTVDEYGNAIDIVIDEEVIRTLLADTECEICEVCELD